MRARITDPLGPHWRRLLPGWSLSTRDGEIELGAGYIDIERAGVLGRRLRARSIIGASTARTREGFAVSLVTKGRRGRPVTLEVGTEADATAIRHALGIGHGGFGSISMPTDRGVVDVGERIVRGLVWFGAGIALVAAIAHAAEMPWDASFPLRLLAASQCMFPLGIPALIFLVTSYRRRRRGAGLEISERGVSALKPVGADHVDYADVGEVYADATGLRITRVGAPDIHIRARASRWLRDRPSREEIDHAAAQIVSAARRAHGEGDAPPPLPLRVGDLAKTEEDARAWLARLDKTATSLAGDGGYRGVAFGESELWDTIESADAPVELRAAAARVLVRATNGDARTRIDAILPRVRIEADARRVRIALDDDAERAAIAWSSLEARELRNWRASK